jgi:4-hydroxy-tetrahydrodipicolinate synthase
MKITGSIVALITPFTGGGIDFETLGKLIELHISGGTDAILVAGTTGEAATWTQEEYSRVVAFVVERVAHRVPVMAGTGTQSTTTTVERTKLAGQLGADCALVVTPYYNKPTQGGLLAHYSAVAEASELPIVLYNVPGRTGVNLLPETVLKLQEVPRIEGIKEASGSISQAEWILRSARPGFVVYSGEDKLNYPLIALGAVGAISVVANVIPKLFAESVHAALSGDHVRARELAHRLLPIAEGLFLETSPAPAKACMHMLGMIPSPELRLPLVGVSRGTQEQLAKILRDLELDLVAGK